MTVSRRDAIVAGAVALPASALLVAAVQAQVTGGRPSDTSPTPAAPGAMPMGEDPNLAACMLLKGRRQIETCTFAKGRSQNEEVKAFLQAEIDEHTTIKAELKKAGFEYPTPVGGMAPGSTGLTGTPGSTGAVATGRTTPTTGRGTPSTGRGATAAGGTAERVDRVGGAMAAPVVMIGTATATGQAAQMLVVNNEVIEQCITNYKLKMPTKQGLKFEKAVIGDQLHEHQALKDHVQVFIRHASAQMQPTLQQGLGIIEKHIATLEAIMEKLEAQKA